MPYFKLNSKFFSVKFPSEYHNCLGTTFLCVTLLQKKYVSGYWIRLDEYSEYPDVNFMYRVILYADTSKNGDYVAWSTFQNFNQLQDDSLRVPLLKVYSCFTVVFNVLYLHVAQH